MREYWEAQGKTYRILVAVLAVTGGVLLRMAFLDILGPRTPFLTFYPAVMIAALFGGAASGLLSTFLLGLLAYFWVLPPMQPYLQDGATWLVIGAFLLSGALLSGISEALHRARRRAARAMAQAALAAQRCELDATIQRLASIVESSDDAIIGADLDTVITSWNEGARRLYGYTAEEAIGQPASLLCLPACVDEVTDILARIRTGERVSNFETVRRHKNGQSIDVSMTLSPIRDAAGGLTGVSAVVRDITARRRTEDALRESEERFREVVEGTDNLVTQVDASGRFLYVNPVARVIFGLEPADCAGRMAFDFIHPDDRGPTRRAFTDWVARKLAHTTFENRQVSQSGEVRRIFWTIDLHYDAQGNLSVMDSIAQDVSERRRAEDALRESEAFSRTIIESSPDCIKMLNRQGELVFMSQGGLRLLEVEDPGTILGRPYMEFWKGSERECCLAALTAARQGQVGRFDGFCPTAKGAPRWWDVTISPISGPGGEIDRFLVISRDETQRKLAADALRAEKERLATIINTSPDIMFLKDAELRYLAANTAHEQVLGIRPQDMLGRTDFEVLPPELARSCRETDLAALRDGTVLQEEQAGERWFRVSKKRVEDAHGKALGVAALISDITGSRRSFEALRESEERFRQLVENAPDTIFVQTEGKFAYINKAGLALYGATDPEQLLGQPIVSRVPPADHEKVLSRIRQLNAERQSVPPVEYRHLRLDGGVLEVEVTAVPLVYGGKNGALVFVRDINERKRVEALRDDMERIARHDLKTPLNAVINLPLLLMEDHNLDPEQMTRLGMIHEAGLRMLEQIDQSLTLYRIETGSFVLEPQPVDLADLARRVAAELGSVSRATGVEFHLDIGPRPALASGDALLCRTMLSNLLKNAVEAAPQGSQAKVCITAQDGHVVAAIHNEGAVPEELRPRFFDKYASSGKRRGAGLGTYSSRLSAEAQGGSITLATSEAAGTTITVRLPVWRSAA